MSVNQGHFRNTFVNINVIDVRQNRHASVSLKRQNQKRYVSYRPLHG